MKWIIINNYFYLLAMVYDLLIIFIYFLFLDRGIGGWNEGWDGMLL